jgi:hypothetical protein
VVSLRSRIDRLERIIPPPYQTEPDGPDPELDGWAFQALRATINRPAWRGEDIELDELLIGYARDVGSKHWRQVITVGLTPSELEAIAPIEEAAWFDQELALAFSAMPDHWVQKFIDEDPDHREELELIRRGSEAKP